MKDIVYVADIEQDIDDLVAIEYLEKSGRLKGVVLDPNKGKEVLLSNFPNIVIYEQIKDSGCKIVFCGGATTKIANHLMRFSIDLLVMNGGFVQQPLDRECLEKFNGKSSIRTFNFNLDVNSTVNMLKSQNLKEAIFVGKNVCHSIKNTKLHIHKNLDSVFKLRDDKRLHDVLMAQEGLRYLQGDDLACEYISGIPQYKSLNKSFTEWYTKEDLNSKFKLAVKIK